MLDSKKLTLMGHTMLFEFFKIGQSPPDGYSLYFGMHGGGGCPKEVNDHQWNNHKHLYDQFLKPGSIWFVPRAPEDAWNMWHLPYIDDMFDYIIQSFLVLKIVNPNKVFITGYSAGGDAVYKLAPRMASQLAGAAMCAGHPNGASMLSLRNCFISLQCGEYDDAYNRNKVCIEYGKTLTNLKNEDPEGYDNFCRLHPSGHWMNLADGMIFTILDTKLRNPYPEKIVWKQCNDVPKTQFYYLSVPKEHCKTATLIESVKKGNTVEIISEDVSEVEINLNENFFDFDQKLKVYFNKKLVFEDFVIKDEKMVRETFENKCDPFMYFCAKVVVVNKNENLIDNANEKIRQNIYIVSNYRTPTNETNSLNKKQLNPKM